jgi:hypothetical protein
MTDMTDKGLFIEEKLLNSLQTTLAGRVNELLEGAEYAIPPIEFGSPQSGTYAVTPVLRLATGERSEKERIIRLDVYVLTITFTLPEGPDSGRNSYAYAGAVAAALGEDPTLGGLVDRAELTGRKYSPPKHPGTGGDWETMLTIRAVVEGGVYVG